MKWAKNEHKLAKNELEKRFETNKINYRIV